MNPKKSAVLRFFTGGRARTGPPRTHSPCSSVAEVLPEPLFPVRGGGRRCCGALAAFQLAPRGKQGPQGPEEALKGREEEHEGPP